MKRFNIKNMTKYALAATAVLAAMSPELAHAAASTGTIGGSANAVASTDLATTMQQLQSQSSGMPNVISWFCYIVGTGFCAYGIMKLKAHSDNAAQNKLGPALGVLLTGAAFLAFPGLAGAVLKTNNLTGKTQFVDGQF
ncbi:MAG: hypothetical protein WDO70_00600 [Alphaproteobacteria bacterium]